MTADLASTLTSAAPYLGIATGIIVPALFWARNVTEKLSRIESNHLTHIQRSGEETVVFRIIPLT